MMQARLTVYGALARALYFQNLRRHYAHRIECEKLGTIQRFWPALYTWWQS